MELVPKDFQHKKAQVKVLNFATAASDTVSAAGTGLSIIPIWYHLTASAAGSAVVYAGTGGSALIRLKFGANSVQSGPWWDPGVTANKLLVLEVEGAVGVGQFAVWYVIVRSGAGNSGTGQ